MKCMKLRTWILLFKEVGSQNSEVEFSCFMGKKYLV